MRSGSILLLFIFTVGCSKKPTSLNVVDSNNVQVAKTDGLTTVDGTLFSGQIVSHFSENDTASLDSYKDGKREGIAKKWYENGQLKEVRFYEDNRKQGFHQGWYPDGKPAFEYHFDQGVYHDTLKEWYDNGQLYLLSHYVNGQQEGRQQAWKKDGELYLNYDVRNGRKYGNAGIKHCKSLWSEVVDDM